MKHIIKTKNNENSLLLLNGFIADAGSEIWSYIHKYTHLMFDTQQQMYT